MKKKPAPKRAPAKKSGAAPDPAVSERSVSEQAAALPGREEIAAAQRAVRAFMDSAGQARPRVFLDRLSADPPQVLLLEGGTAEDRLAAAHYWILLLNCPRTGQAEGPAPKAGVPAVPCLECAECIRLLTHMHRDCFFFDGLEGSIKIDEVRAMRAVLGEAAREARRRVVLLREAQSLVEAAANALLKSLEEPRPGTSFILLAPQRERLLPTLVSRSLVLTLPWPDAEGADDAKRRERLAPWEAALCSFLQSGRDLFERSGGKGAVDAALVHDLAGLFRRALAGCILAPQRGAPPAGGLEGLLARLSAERLRMLDEALAECQDSLLCNVNPALTLEWLATRVFLLLPRPWKR